MSTTKDVLNEDEQAAFQRFIRKGKGFVGVHAATDTEYEWPWFNQLVGAYFKSHPKQQDAVLHIVDKKHPATKHLPDTWKRWDEWYNFKDIQPGLKVLITLDESSYTGGENGTNHPIGWYHSFDGGRAFIPDWGIHTNLMPILCSCNIYWVELNMLWEKNNRLLIEKINISVVFKFRGG